MDLAASFALVFLVVGGTEFIDRTNFALIGLAARYSPVSVWAGAAAAFVITTAVAVVAGALLIDALRPELIWLRIGGGVFLIGYAVYLWRVPESERGLPAGRTAGVTAFLTILLLEMGDTTQLLTIGFVFSLGDPVLVGLAAGLALVAVAATAAFLGSRLGARFEPRALEKYVVVVLALVGLLTVVFAIEPGWIPSF